MLNSKTGEIIFMWLHLLSPCDNVKTWVMAMEARGESLNLILDIIWLQLKLITLVWKENNTYIHTHMCHKPMMSRGSRYLSM